MSPQERAASVRCAGCATVPPERIVTVTDHGHAIIATSTGRACACSADGGYYTRPVRTPRGDARGA